MKRKNVSVDRITELPECIIHQIMSHLSSKEVVRTSVLAKRWFHVKKNYPVLGFPLTMKTKDLVYKSFLHFNGEKLRLQAFGVYMTDPSLSSDLHSLVRLALENQVKELKISLFGKALCSSSCAFPRPIFTSKTLTILKLCGCVLDQPLFALNSLKKLHLEGCHFNRQIILKNADCPLLEDLVLLDCEGFNFVYISNLFQLHTVEFCLEDDEDIEEFVISCPSIQSFSIIAPKFKSWSVINMDGCDHLKSLHLRSKMMTDAEFHALLSKLPLLEELYLFKCDKLKTVSISSPRIKTLQVCPERDSCLEFIGIEAPSLINFLFLAEGKQCVLKMENCCNLETLVLFWRLITETMFHDLISKFPLLENLWISGCQKLRRIEIPNLQLKRLHIVRCFRLKAVKVDSPNLFDFCCTGREEPVFSVAARNATGGLRFERDHEDSPCTYSFLKLLKILKYFVQIKDESLVEIIADAAEEFPEM